MYLHLEPIPMHESNTFRPHQHKSHSSLPKDKKDEYSRVPGGGFIKKSAKEFFKSYENKAAKLNNQRTLKQKLLGQGKFDPMDLTREAALQEDREKEWDKRVYEKNVERVKLSWKQYKETIKAVEDGTFIVKKGSFVFRVVGGIKVGIGKLPEKDDHISNVYATPHISAIEPMPQYNDKQQQYFDGSHFDNIQQVAMIKVDSFIIPEPDISHNLFTDKDQVVVTGKVVNVLSPNDFLRFLFYPLEKV